MFKTYNFPITIFRNNYAPEMAPKLTLLELNGFAQEFEPNGKISTVSFVNSSYEVISIIESLGHLFYPVVLDMKGNVDHLQSHYKEDEERRKYIEDMVLNDEQRKTHSRLLWLNRALEMIDIFFYLLLNDEEVLMEKSENIRPLINQAYNEALKPYHGFFLQNAFKVSFLESNIQIPYVYLFQYFLSL